MQDDEIGRENVSLNVSDNTQRLSFPFAAGLPGTYYYGVCIGAECSAGEEIIVAGLAVTRLVTNATRREGTDGDVFFGVESDDVLRLMATLSCFGPQECSDINVSYYRVLDDGTVKLLEPTNPSVPPLTLSNRTEDFPSIDDTEGYTKDTRYYACLGSMMPSQEISYGEDNGTCSTVVVRFDDDDGDGVSRRTDVDDDGDGLIEIGTAAELDAMRYELTGSGFRENAPAEADVTGCPVVGCSGYELTAGIDLASYGQREDGSAGWQPIGNVSAPFVAVFAGNNFTIRNLYINRPAEDRIGLFGRVGAGAELKDVRLEVVDVSGRDGVGGLVGNGAGVTIIASSVTGMLNGREGVGGLVGAGTGVTITASSVTGMLNGRDEVGGLVGMGVNATITASSVTGRVNGTDSIGGLVGAGANATIIASYVAGTVSGRNLIGGLVGAGNFASITASYAVAMVSEGNSVGGLMGSGSGATITASYAVGNVRGDENVGGLLGEVSGSDSTITSSYWDRDASGITSGFGEPLSTLQLQFPLAELRTAWEDQLCPASAESAWDFGESYQYPALTCPPGGVAAQDEQRTLPAFVGLLPADISSPTVVLLTVDGVNTTTSGMSAARDGALLLLTASLSCAGSAPCEPVRVDYYVSADAVINSADALVGTDFVPFVRGGGTTVSVTNVTMNATDGSLRYYGACVGDVCAAATELLLQTDTEALAVRLEGPAARISSGSDEVTWLVDLSSCSTACFISFSVYGSRDDGLNVLNDEKIEERQFSLDSGEGGTFPIVFTSASSGYYGVCTPTECFAASVVRIIINNPNDQDDGDGVAAAEDVDDDGDGLIEIAMADELNNIRFVLDGSGYRTGASAPKDVTGCPAAGCSGYELTATIDLASYGRDYDNGSGWEPVGNSSSPFTAIFAGNDFPIHNLTINRSRKTQVGFFGVLGGRALVQKVSLPDVEVSGNQQVGGLAGLVQRGGTILSSVVSGQVVGILNDVGGLVGDGSGATIISSSATGMVSGGAQVGGLAGDGFDAIITASSATGMVSGGTQVGGLVGAGGSAIITASYATGLVVGTVRGGSDFGGLVGYGQSATITSSYATGNVSGSNDVGGLVGDGFGATIAASYALGTARGLSFIGGLVGDETSATITASYWDSDTSGVGVVERQTTVALQSPTGAEGIYATWNGTCPNDETMASWDFGETYQYPALTCPPGGVVAQYVQRTLPAFVGFAPADISSPTLDFFTVNGANLTESGRSAARHGAVLLLTASLSCAGSAPCVPARVDYYVSADDLINSADTLVRTDFVPFTRGGGTAVAETNATLNATDGNLRYYGACVGDVCAAGTELLLQTDTQVPAVRLEGPAVRSSQGSDEVTWLVDLSCPGVCLNSLLFLRASADASLTVDDDLIEMREVSLDFEENRRTDMITFTPASSGYYGLCTPTECFAGSAVRIIIDADADGVAAAEDVDDDGDGLIEIGTADELNNIRYVLDGSGYRTGASAPKNETGCPTAGCSGYELVASIDLASYGRDYDNGKGWEPLGNPSSPFTAIFAGNDFPIHNLTINRSSENQTGFFGVLGASAAVRSVSLVALEVTGGSVVGGLAGRLNEGGTILSSAVTGRVVGTGTNVGGLVGFGQSATITTSYATGTVSGQDVSVGGLVGDGGGTTITSSYAAGTVSGGNDVGGLVGNGIGATITTSYATGTVIGIILVSGLVGEDLSATITASYWDSDLSGRTSGSGSPQTTAALQSPTGATGIYATWNGTCPNDETMDSWDFGTATQYPVLNCTPGGAAAQSRP